MIKIKGNKFGRSFFFQGVREVCAFKVVRKAN